MRPVSNRDDGSTAWPFRISVSRYVYPTPPSNPPTFPSTAAFTAYSLHSKKKPGSKSRSPSLPILTKAVEHFMKASRAVNERWTAIHSLLRRFCSSSFAGIESTSCTAARPPQINSPLCTSRNSSWCTFIQTNTERERERLGLENWPLWCCVFWRHTWRK